MNGCINVAEAPEFMVSRCPPNTVETAYSASILGTNSPLENTPHKAGVEGDGTMSAGGTLIQMATLRRRTAAQDSIDYL